MGQIHACQTLCHASERINITNTILLPTRLNMIHAIPQKSTTNQQKEKLLSTKTTRKRAKHQKSAKGQKDPLASANREGVSCSQVGTGVRVKWSQHIDAVMHAKLRSRDANAKQMQET